MLKDRELGKVNLRDVHWFASANHRVTTDLLKPAGKNSDPGLFEAIQERGWKEDETIIVQPFPLPYKIGNVEYTADLAIVERQNALELWRQADETIALANAMEKVWCDDEGNFHRPLYMGVDGNRRGLSLPRILANASDATLLNFYIPVVCRVFGDNTERVVEQVSANTARQMSGVKNLTWPDICKAATQILAAGGNENTLRRALGKVGTAQKAYAIVKLSLETAKPGRPSLLERIGMERPKKAEYGYAEFGYVSAESLDKEKLRKILKGEPLAVADESAKLPKADRLERYIASTFVEGTSTVEKVLGKDEWREVPAEAGSPVDKIRQIHLSNGNFLALLESNPELFSAQYTGTIAVKQPEPEVKQPKAKAKVKAK